MDPRTLLRQFKIRPKKSLGQNFLIDPNAAQQVVAAADLSVEESVLEVGPGLGALTRHLARAAQRVVAVELDQRLMPVLAHELRDYPNVELVRGDILEIQPSTFFSSEYKVVANIPYYITSALLRHLLEAEPQPSLLVLTVQEEVARRIVAKPGDMSLLAVSVQIYGQPKIVGRLKAGAFYPRPKVNSAIIRIDLEDAPHSTLSGRERDKVFELAKAGFGQRRKQLRNSLAGGLHRDKQEIDAALREAGINPKRRAETLRLEEWIALTRSFDQHTRA
jgi:16S rRNA (adenine1518-N6/adenine1519-N6)-dimethyltransferase